MGDAVRIHLRILNGLILREFSTRFQNKGRGLLLTFLIPMVRAGLLAAIRTLGGFPAYAGMEILPFIVSGVLYVRSFILVSRSLVGATVSGKSTNWTSISQAFW